MNGSDVLTKVTGKTNSELILFFVVAAVVLIALAVPLYKLFSKSAKEKRELYFKRDTMMLEVVRNNSSAISKLTTLIEGNNQNCHECKVEQTYKMDIILAKQDDILTEVRTASAVILDRRK